MMAHYSLSPMLHLSLSVYHKFVMNACSWLLIGILFLPLQPQLHRADLGVTAVDEWRRCGATCRDFAVS